MVVSANSSNLNVLQKWNKEKLLLITIKSRKLEYLGHIMRKKTKIR